MSLRFEKDTLFISLLILTEVRRHVRHFYVELFQSKSRVCVLSARRERSKVPLIVRQCVEEIERRGMEEVGIYRVSGVATDIQALKAAFDSSEFRLTCDQPIRQEAVQ